MSMPQPIFVALVGSTADFPYPNPRAYIMITLLCILLAAILIITLWYSDSQASQSSIPLRDKWPPISEDEFIRRCSPGVNRERALKVRRIISEQLGVDYDRVYPEQRLVEDLGCD